MSQSRFDLEGVKWRNGHGCPRSCLCHNPTKEALREQIRPFVRESNSTQNHAVYVLNCRKRDIRNATNIALESLDVRRVPWWINAACAAERIYYVGVSKRVFHRLYKHVIASGANFTKIFPPTEIVDIEWYSSLAPSYRAEVEKAERLREKHPKAFVAQPG